CQLSDGRWSMNLSFFADMNLNLVMQGIIVLPLVAVVGILATGQKPNIREAVSLVASVLVFALVWHLYQGFMAGGVASITWIELLPGLNISFKTDALGLLFALLASFLSFVTSLYAIGYMRGHHEKNQTRFYSFFAIAIAAVMAIAFAENLFTLFIFYEVLTLSTYPLVTHAGSDKARRGGRTYLNILLGTS